METVKINGREYAVKYTIRALFIYEQITGKPFAVETSMDSYIFVYAILLANNPDNAISWDEFVDACDADPTLFGRLNEAVNRASKMEQIMQPSDDEGGKKKKK